MFEQKNFVATFLQPIFYTFLITCYLHDKSNLSCLFFVTENFPMNVTDREPLPIEMSNIYNNSVVQFYNHIFDELSGKFVVLIETRYFQLKNCLLLRNYTYYYSSLSLLTDNN